MSDPFYFVFDSYDEAAAALPQFDSDRAKALRQRAEEKRRREQESFDRCDTDGFLTQWCLSIGASEDAREAEMENSGCLVIEPALMDIESGEIVAACVRIMSNRFASWQTELKWQVMRPIKKADSREFPWFWCTDYKKPGNFEKFGLRKVWVMAPGVMLSRSPGNRMPEPRGISGLGNYSGKYPYIDYQAAGLPA